MSEAIPERQELVPIPGSCTRRYLPFGEDFDPHTSTGRWLTLHAAHLSGQDSGVAVVLEPARAAEALPVMLLAHGLTSREAEIAQLVVRGYSTRQIVDQLHISRHMVRDHLKAVFDKTGVRSRCELVAQLLGGPHG
jgi:DNA-binding CsgD family transcriptional regulator